ncbi:hypothetical protein AYI70_g233 [Smittium culicis]|uniref:Uncharacterized protein n=1 Tax=Smittium culicis TaxID=133412 RepID=A0A1R1YHI0_9FUNG|nr:hypothetical protein AYI70_g233 [Smittium culicis]
MPEISLPRPVVTRLSPANKLLSPALSAGANLTHQSTSVFLQRINQQPWTFNASINICGPSTHQLAHCPPDLNLTSSEFEAAVYSAFELAALKNNR